MNIDRFNDALCACCQRAATGIGHTPHASKPILWLCDDPACIQIARDSYMLPQEKFSLLEAKAAVEASDAMGRRLDEVGEGGRFDGMAPEIWLDAMRAGIAEYRVSLVKFLKSEAPF